MAAWFPWVVLGMARIHWIAGLLAVVAWGWHRAITRGSLSLPQGWWSLPGAMAVLVVATAVSPHPTELPWVGLLQWFALGGLVAFFQSQNRNAPETWVRIVWLVLALAALDTIVWSWSCLTSYFEWWRVRSDGLPWFPFRIRLFGSHGSTQAAAWIGASILITRLFLLPTLRSARARKLAWAWLGFQSVVMALCDSRLGFGGLVAGAMLAGRARRPDLPLLGLCLVQAMIWTARDHLHPSAIVTGGGQRSGVWLLALVLVPMVVSMLPVERAPKFAKRLLRGWPIAALGASLLAPFALVAWSHRGLVAWSTGRADFWNEAVQVALEHPVLGGGPWSYAWNYSLHHEWTQAFLPMHPHNWVLEVLVTGGSLLLVLVGILVARILSTAWKDKSPTTAPWIPLLGYWCAAMVFDSPLSSPQFLIVTAFVWGGAWSLSPGASRVDIPRVALLLPLLLLVPAARVVNLVLDGSSLPDIGVQGLRGEWGAASRRVLEQDSSLFGGPQWFRARVFARTTLAGEDSLRLRPLVSEWDSVLRLDPANILSRVSKDWVAWKSGGGELARNDFLALCDTLRGMWIGPPANAIPEAWRSVYPTDGIPYWVEVETRARRDHDAARLAWVRRWLAFRAPSRSLVGNCLDFRRGSQPRELALDFGKEESIYGTRGVGWALPPLVHRDAISQACVF